MVQLGFHWTDFDETRCSNFYRKSVEKIQVSLKSDKNNGYFTWRRFDIFDDISLNSSYNEKCFRQKVVKRMKPHIFMFNNLFPKIAPKNVVENERPQMTSKYGVYTLHAGLARLYALLRNHTTTRPVPTCTHAHTQTHLFVGFLKTVHWKAQGDTRLTTVCLLSFKISRTDSHVSLLFVPQSHHTHKLVFPFYITGCVCAFVIAVSKVPLLFHHLQPRVF
jgi:hypothetical protein